MTVPSKRQTLALVICLVLSVPAASGQSRNEFASWFGVSAGTPTLIGKSERVSYTAFAVRYSRTLVQRPAFELRYAVDAIPVARLHYLNQDSELETVQGRGLSPIGLELGFRPGKRIEPAVGVSGGIVHFDRRVPDFGRKLNFSGDFGASLRIRVHAAFGVRVAYKYLHLSNAYTAPSNPGFDANLLTFGVDVRR